MSQVDKAGQLELLGNPSYAEITDKVVGLVLDFPRKKLWLFFMGLSALLLLLFLISLGVLFGVGVGIWGINVPVAWGFAITNFVWWIGIGHAGTFISAILLLCHQTWRRSINRFAEAMTLFALMCAGLFPLLHLGRPWFFYWMLPYPDTMGLTPQYRSPLVWDLFAVITYGLISFLFWYVGLIPDLAAVRDRAKSRGKRLVYGVLALGWRNSARHWQIYEKGYYLMAGLATALVISVHSIVGMDFAYAIVPGWHATLFPPYFVAGAIYSGFAMVLTLAVPLRALLRLHDMVTLRHFENCAKLLLLTGLIVTYSYVIEWFLAWYSPHKYELTVLLDRALGAYAPGYWCEIAGNVVAPQLLWFNRVRTSPLMLFLLSLIMNVGMWAERFVIVVSSLHRGYMPSSWKMYHPTVWDWCTLIGSFGLFLFFFFLFVRFLPIIPAHEVKKLAHENTQEVL